MPISEKQDNSSGASFLVGTTEFFIPLDTFVDKEEELKKIDIEIQRLTGFLNSVNKKLSNTRFVESAPKDVVEMEYKKQSDAQTKIEKLNVSREQLIKN